MVGDAVSNPPFLGIEIVPLVLSFVGGFFCLCEIFERTSNAFGVRPGYFLRWGLACLIGCAVLLAFVCYLDGGT